MIVEFVRSSSPPGDILGISLTNSAAPGPNPWPSPRPRPLGGGHSLPGPPPRWPASLPRPSPTGFPTSARSLAKSASGGRLRRSRSAPRRRRRERGGGGAAVVRARGAPTDRRQSKVPAERFGIRLGVKEHLLAVAWLGTSDRAALQSLIPLAGAVGAGTIFSLFCRHPARRRAAGLRSLRDRRGPDRRRLDRGDRDRPPPRRRSDLEPRPDPDGDAAGHRDAAAGRRQRLQPGQRVLRPRAWSCYR